MKLTDPINTYPLRLFWGQLKARLGLIKVRGWEDTPCCFAHEKNTLPIDKYVRIANYLKHLDGRHYFPTVEGTITGRFSRRANSVQEIDHE